MAACEGCGQLTVTDGAWTVRGLCPECRAAQYGGRSRSEVLPLFVPAPEPMAGQLGPYQLTERKR